MDKQPSLRQIREDIGMSMSEAGHFMQVTQEQWEEWERLDLLGKLPSVIIDRLLKKLDDIRSSAKNFCEVVVVILNNPPLFPEPIDSVSSNNYLGLDGGNVIKSLMLMPNGRFCVSKVKFNPEDNPHVIKFCYRNTPR